MAHPLRVQLSRKKGWKKPPDAIVVSRPRRWGNPFWTAFAFLHWLNTGSIYVNELVKPMSDKESRERRQWILDHLDGLRGKQVCCWCSLSAECHADILAEMANQ